MFAELYGKLDPNASDLERREDILTSTTFGTLLVAGANDLLVSWLNSARRLEPDGRLGRESLGLGSAKTLNYWFWPSLSGRTQPDIVLQIGQRLVVVEAKYGSNKSSTAPDTEEVDALTHDTSTSDQLLRQWQAVQPDVAGLVWYPDGLREAITGGCERDLVYLVSARRVPRALRELRESQRKICTTLQHDASLWLLTWQELHGLLVRQCQSGLFTPRWIPELASLLERRRNLASFLGFAHVLREAARSQALSGWANAWSTKGLSDPCSVFSQLDLLRFHRAVSVVDGWAALRHSEPPRGYFAALARSDLFGVERLVGHLERQDSWFFQRRTNE